MVEEVSLKQYSAVIFDLDGVIIDSEPLSMRAWKKALEDFGYQITSQAIQSYIGHSLIYIESNLKNKFGKDFPFDAVYAHKNTIFQDSVRKGDLRLKPGVDDVIGYLKAQGKKIAVASSTLKYNVIFCLRSVGYDKTFDVIIGGDEVQKPKPSPEIYIKSAVMLECDCRDCLVVEDSDAGVLAAKEAGMRVCLIKDLISPKEETLKIAEGYFQDHYHLLDYLKSQ